MFDYKAELRLTVDDSSSGAIYHQGYTINENERSQTDSKTFTLAPSAERDVCFTDWSEINDVSIISDTTSSVTLTVSGSASPPIPFTEHFSLQTSDVEDIVIKNTSSVTGTYRTFFAGE